MMPLNPPLLGELEGALNTLIMAKRDYYEVLGVSKTATEDEIKNIQKTEQKPEAAKRIRVFPNDPCPCGSGKKYKKCCGRR